MPQGSTGGRPATGSTRLGSTDATLWAIERDPALRTTIVAALILERPVPAARLVDALEVASRRFPRLRQRVAAPPGGIGRPVWELDRQFDVRRHVRLLEVPRGADDAAILEAATQLATEDFDRARPLWSCTYLGGDAGRSALLVKVHHSLTDGVGGLAVLAGLLDDRDDAVPEDPDDVALPVPTSTAHTLVDDAGSMARRALRVPLQATEVATTTALHPLRSTTGLWKGMRSAARLLGPASAPLSPSMRERSAGRWLAMTDTDLERLHAAARAHGCTVNHLFFAVVLGALAEHHRRHGVPAERLRVSMPVNLRNGEDATAGNRWAPVRLVVPVDIEDPIERMLAMRERLDTARREPALPFSNAIAGSLLALPPQATTAVVGGMMRGVDLTLTNVPGLTEPHWLCGARVERIHAFAPTAGAALNVSLVSHVGRACIGVVCDTAAVPAPDDLRRLLEEQLEETISACEERAPGQPVAPPTRTPGEPRSEPARERLSALDTAFLRLERDRIPMHIGAALVVDGSPLRDARGAIRLDEIRRHVDTRIRLLPRFTRRLAEVPLGAARPSWVDDPDFDVERHVRLVTLGAPAGRHTLEEEAARLFERPLDRDRPLWDLTIVDGLADGRVGIVQRVHHALIDGVSGVELAEVLFDVCPVTSATAPLPPGRAAEHGEVDSLVGWVGDAVTDQFGDPVAFGRALLGAASVDGGGLTDRMRSLAEAVGELADAAMTATATSFNHPVGAHRVLHHAALDLDRIDAVREPLGATVNDVVLACVAGALRRWYEDHGDEAVDLRVLAPVSTRRHGMLTEPGNQVGALLVTLPLSEPDPRRRLRRIQRETTRRKAAHQGEAAAAVLAAADHLPAIWYPVLTHLAGSRAIVNLVVTNVPGTPATLYFHGARIEEIVPIVPLGPQLGIGVAAMSYGRSLSVGVLADPAMCSDVDLLTAAIDDELDGLVG